MALPVFTARMRAFARASRRLWYSKLFEGQTYFTYDQPDVTDLDALAKLYRYRVDALAECEADVPDAVLKGFIKIWTCDGNQIWENNVKKPVSLHLRVYTSLQYSKVKIPVTVRYTGFRRNIHHNVMVKL